MAAGQVLPDVHNVHTIVWTDDSSVSGESYNVYVSDKAITDVGAANVYRIGTQIAEGKQVYEHALLTPFAPGPVTNYYAVTIVKGGAETTKVAANVNATNVGTPGTTEYGQPAWWFIEAPFVDAEFGDWTPYPTLYLSPNDPHFLGGASDGPQDQSGDVGLGFDATNVYFMGDITDDALVNTVATGDGGIWAGDNVEWYVGFYDMRPSDLRHTAMNWGREGDPAGATPDWQLDIAGNAFDDANRSQNYAAGAHGTYQVGMGNLGLEVLTKVTAKGWNLEGAMPLSGLAQDPAVIAPFKPKLGMILPATVALADGDDPSGGRQGQLFWGRDAAQNNSWNTPSAWEKEFVIYDPKVFGLSGGATAVEAKSWGQVKAEQ